MAQQSEEIEEEDDEQENVDPVAELKRLNAWKSRWRWGAFFVAFFLTNLVRYPNPNIAVLARVAVVALESSCISLSILHKDPWTSAIWIFFLANDMSWVGLHLAS